jgi:hypothetical protein
MIKEQDRKFRYNGRLYEVERLPTEGKKDIDDFRNKKIIK